MKTTLTALLVLAAASFSSAYASDNIALKIDRGAALLQVSDRQPAAVLQPADRHTAAAALLHAADRHLTLTRGLVMQALGYLGIRYKYGGSTPDTGFDCSGLVRYVVGQALGLVLPRDARSISEVGARISTEHLQPGDLVFFNTMNRPFSHVGIYIGEQRFIHAPASGGAVELVSLSERYWRSRFDGARRLEI